jgi:hypothetical protein
MTGLAFSSWRIPTDQSRELPGRRGHRPPLLPARSPGRKGRHLRDLSRSADAWHGNRRGRVPALRTGTPSLQDRLAASEAAAVVEEVCATFREKTIVRILAGALQGRVLSSSRQTTRRNRVVWPRGHRNGRD